MGAPILWTRNGSAVGRADIPEVSTTAFRAACLDEIARGSRLCALAVLPPAGGLGSREALLAVLADDVASRVGLVRTPVPEARCYPALSTDAAQAVPFEREIAEGHGVTPEGHPWLKPLRNHAAAYPFFQVSGRGVHEVAVGPVHAGIIEPGHFRFQCHGEKVLHLEVRLGYQHRGAEALFLKSAPPRRLALAESFAGDTSVGHATAYCAVLEGLAGADIPLDAQRVRGIALELERIASHVGDLGALSGDVAYLPGAAWLGRMRGDALQLLLDLSGSRFGRGLVVPGGVRHGLNVEQRSDFLARLEDLERDLAEISEIVFESPSVVSRFEQTGILRRDDAEALGVVGPAARASGLDRDVRRDHPSGIYRFAHIPAALQDAGDVLARAVLRRTEAQRSLQFVREHVSELGGGPLSLSPGSSRPDTCVVSLVEGWRGEIAHVAVTDPDGDLAWYKVVDPSFHNWHALSLVMRDRQISDFPLCNKSFNLSYSGHDL